MNPAVRRAVLSHLADGSDPRFGRSYFVSTIADGLGCPSRDVWEVLWGLLGDGLVYLDTAGQGSGTDNWRWTLSSDGLRATQGGNWEPRDFDGYLERARREIPNLDVLVEMYLVEALRSFNGRSYLATSVMLGVAAERAFLVMARAYADSSLVGADALAKELARTQSNYFTLWTEFRKRFEPIRKEMPDGLSDALTLDAIADLIRLTRNEAGHPTGRQIDEETARVHLTIAPVYFRKMQLLTDHFSAASSEGGR